MRKIGANERRKILRRNKEKLKCINKTWVDFPSGFKAVATDLWIVLQMATMAFLYVFFTVWFPPFFLLSVFLTLCAAVHVFISERDGQSKASWLFLFLITFGCGYIIYILANRRVCYGYGQKRYAQIYARSLPHVCGTDRLPASQAVKNDCKYLYNAAGCVPYSNTKLTYFSDARTLFDNMIARLDEAENFIFLEFFIVADSVLTERLIEVLRRKTAEGVKVLFLYDDVGSQGVLSRETKNRIRAAGVNFKVFAPLLSLFSFALDYRDHRKIVVVDGKTGYVGGCNVSDQCTNEQRMEGIWKDAGLRLDGAAVDGLTLSFLRQWEFATKEVNDFGKYLNHYESCENHSIVVPYAGGPEIEEFVCRGIYANIISGAQQKLYIMSPYFIPDGDLMNAIIAKAKSGVDVRLVLPAVPDYAFVYRVSRDNAERLMKHGVKVYYCARTFSHSKVVLSENCMSVGSVNMDMRAFYLEFDNGIYTDDKGAMEAADADFKGVFAANQPHTTAKHSIFSKIITAVLRIVSPLM